MLSPLLCLALAFTEPAAAETARQTYDLRKLVNTLEPAYQAIGVLPLPPSAHAEWFEDAEIEYEPPLDTFLELLGQVVAPEEWEYQGRAIERIDDGTRLLVEAPPAVQEEVRRFLAYGERVFTRRIVLQVDVLRVPGGAFGRGNDLPVGHLGSAERERLATLIGSGALPQVESFRLELVPGLPATWSALERVPYVRDLEIEIAEAAAVHDPVIDFVPLGVIGSFRATLDAQDRALVSFVVRDTWRAGPTLEIPVRSDYRFVSERGFEPVAADGMIESPQVAFVTLAGSALLAPDGAAAVMAARAGARGAEDGTLVRLTLEGVEPAPRHFESGERMLAVRDLGGAIGQGLAIPVPAFHALATHRHHDDYPDDALALVLGVPPAHTAGSEDAHLLLDRILNEDDGDDPLGDLMGHYLYSLGSKASVPAWTEGCMKLLGTRQPIPAAVGRAAPAGGSPGAAPLFALLADAGDGLALAGTQRSYVLDFDVDVANRSSAPNPTVHAPPSAFVAHVRPVEVQERGFEALLTWRSHLLVNEQVAATKSAGLAPLHQPVFATGSYAGAVPLAPRPDRDLTSFPVAGGRAVLSVSQAP